MAQTTVVPPQTGWIRLAWIFTIAGILVGIGTTALAFFAPELPWVLPLQASTALGWLFVAAWGPHALAWRYQRRLERWKSLQAEWAGADQARQQEMMQEYKPRDFKRVRGGSHWLQMAVVFLGTGAAIATWWFAWPQAREYGGLIWFVLMVLFAFPLLVMSNALSHHTNPSCIRQARFARFATLSFLITGLTTAMGGIALPIDIMAGDAPLSIWALRCLAIVQITLASEWILRTAISPFMPVRSPDQLNESFVLNLVAGRVHAANAEGFQEQFGIDISQSWAVQFIRQSSAWLMMVLAVATWLSTAITTLRVDERGLYQRMGHIERDLLEPGLHVTLPWPFGSVRRISYGGIQEVRLNDEEVRMSEIITGVEAPSGKQDDRIWSQNHGGELFLMIANQPRLSSGNGGHHETQRPYELYHADVVITYRVGLDPQSSLQSTYHVADPAQLVAQIGRRELIDLFNNRTAEDLLFADFSEFSRSSHEAVQRRLDTLYSGIEIVDVIFEAVHPPIDTASTFHRVHGAEKESAVRVDVARAEAEKEQATAQINAARINDQARADAYANTARARAERVAFGAERRAYEQEREVFIFERSLQAFENAFANKNLIIVDPEISAEQGLVVDLREQAIGAAPQSDAAQN